MLDQARMQETVELGVRNQEIIELVRRHCSHAVVTKPSFGGSGLLEAHTGLPIDMRTVRCPHAAHPAPAGMQLEGIALTFWESNCRNCPHRDVRDIPNLATLGAERLAERERDHERDQRQRDTRDEQRAARAVARHARIAGESPATRVFVELLDGVDAEESDSRAGQLVDQARAAPELCSPLAGQILMDCSREVSDDRLLQALDYLERADRVPSEPLLASALLALARRPSRVAAQIVVRLQAGLTPGALRPTLRSLVWLAGKSSEPFEDGPRYYDGIALAARVELPSLLDELRAGIEDNGSHRRGRWAYAAAALMDQRPETASVLAQPLVLALGLPDSHSGFAGSPRFGIQAGLRAALEADPDNTSALYDRLARRVDQEQRGVLFHAFTDVLRRWRGETEPPAELTRVALDGVFGRLGGDWGDDLVDHAIEALELVARRRSELLVDRVDAVFGALLAAVAGPQVAPTSAQILRPPPPLEALERSSQQFVRGNRIARLRKLVGLLAPLRPEETLDGVEAVLDRASLPDDDATQELRGQAVRLLGDLGKRPEMAPRVLPRLVGFALGPSVIERTRAIEALGEIGTVAHRRLPEDVLELVSVWLADSYMGPHQAAVRALNDGFPVGESSLIDVIGRLMILAKVYASEDAAFLNLVLERLWSLSRRLDPEFRTGVERVCLQRAEHLSATDIERFVRWRAVREGDTRNADLAADRLLQALSDPEYASDLNDDGDDAMRVLRDMPAEILRSRAAVIAEAARVHLPHDVHSALAYVEVLQYAGCWKEAEDLAEEVLQEVPDTVEDRGARAWVRSVAAAARLEHALAEDAANDVAEALHDWNAAVDDLESVRAERKSPWEMLP
jgi:hypothetical protein